MRDITPEIVETAKKHLGKLELIDTGVKGYVPCSHMDNYCYVVTVENASRVKNPTPNSYDICVYLQKDRGHRKSIEFIPSAISWGKHYDIYCKFKNVTEKDVDAELGTLIRELAGIKSLEIKRSRNKHEWEPTDSQGYCMECINCGMYISIYMELDEDGESQWSKEIDADCPGIYGPN